MTESPVRIGVVGVGSIGRHHARILAELPSARLVGVFDTDSPRARAIAEAHGTRATESLDELLGEVDAVVVAVPTPAHAEVGLTCIEAGVDVLIEKPIAVTLEDADRLIAAAERHGRLLGVGHVERFNPAVESIMTHVTSPGFIEIHRLGTFVERSLEVDVIADLMIHDIDIVHALVGGEVSDIRAVGVAVLSDEIDIANARLEFSTGCIVNMTASRVSMNRVRKVRVFQPRAYFSVDYSAQTVACFQLDTEVGDRPSIAGVPIDVTPGEPLRAELEDFVAAVNQRGRARVDGAAGRRALKTALAVRAALSSPAGL